MKHVFAGRWRPVAGLIGASIILALAGCNGGGGGGGGGDATGGAPTGGPGTAAIWYDYWVNGKQLRSLPREDSVALPVSLGTYSTAGSFWLYSPVSGSGSTTTIDNRNAVLLYIANNRFYRLATAGATQPAPIQVSGETAASSMCDWHDPQLHTPNVESATFKYQMPGKDQRCLTSDDEYREIRIGMAATEAPLAIGRDRYRANELYAASGALSGYLVAAAAGGIYWHDAGFGNPRQLASAASVLDSYSDFWLLGQSPDGRYRLLELFTSGTYLFDTESLKLIKVLDRGSIDALGYYNGSFYLSSTISQGSSTVYRVAADGSAPAQQVLTGLERVVGITGNALVYRKTGTGGVDIHALDLSLQGASPRLIKTLAAVDDVALLAGRVYYTATVRSGSAVTSASAGSFKTDGSDDVVFDGAVWVGNDHRNGAHPEFPLLASDRLYLAQGVSFSSQAEWTGGHLSWVDANTGRIAGNIGAMPANIYAYRFASLDSGSTVLGLGYSADGNTTFYLRANRATGKVVSIDQSPSGYNYNWKSDWSIAR